MKIPALLFALSSMAVLAGGASAADFLSVGPGQASVIDGPSPDDICPGSFFKTNDDGSYENGYTWAYGGLTAPYYGAWAEGFTLDSNAQAVCGLKLALTQIGNQDGWLMDLYVWDAAGGDPGNVISMTAGVDPGPIGIWPTVTQHDLTVPDYAVEGDYFVGWWPNWIGTGPGWYVAADENGPGGGIPRTNIAPGIGWPTGWCHPGLAFPACQDLGIGVYESPQAPIPPPDPPVPTQEGTWGALKAFYE